MDIITAQEINVPFNVAIVASRFNTEITHHLFEGALARLQERGIPEDKISVVWVPGAIEIPLAALRLAKLGGYEVIIVLGAVIRGETDHYDYVCQYVTHGCLKVSLEQNLPVIFGVLTTDNEEQAMDRVGGAFGHKGKEAADAAFDMVSILRQI